MTIFRSRFALLTGRCFAVGCMSFALSTVHAESAPAKEESVQAIKQITKNQTKVGDQTQKTAIGFQELMEEMEDIGIAQKS
jgi:hypothetical protein